MALITFVGPLFQNPFFEPGVPTFAPPPPPDVGVVPGTPALIEPGVPTFAATPPPAIGVPRFAGG